MVAYKQQQLDILKVLTFRNEVTKNTNLQRQT